MQCLKDYIGVKGCNIAPPDSGEYINELPGIEFLNVEQVANADQVTWAGVWADVQNRAIKKFELDVLGTISGFDRRYKLRRITQSVDLGRDISTTTTAASPSQRGLLLELNNQGDQCYCSNLQGLYIQSISYYATVGASYTITITDADHLTQLDQWTKTFVAGWNTILSDKFYDGSRRIYVTVDATNNATQDYDLSGFNLSGYWQNNWCSDCGWNDTALFFSYDCTGTAQVRGVTADTNFQNPVIGQNSFGISIVFSLRCTYNAVVCQNKRYFSNAWRLCLGIELMNQTVFSSRLNRWTTSDKKKAIDLRNLFEVQYRGGMIDNVQYEGELLKACQSIDLDLSDCCIECDSGIEWRETQL